MKKSLVIASALTVTALAVFGPAAAASAVTVSNPGPATDSIGTFGPRATSVYGQTLTVPAGSNTLDGFSFQITAGGPMVVRGEVYAWDGQKATGPSLFESAPVTINGDSTTRVVPFRTGGVAVTPGTEYVLFATVLRDEQPAAPGYSSWPTTGDVLPGQLVWYNASSFDEVTTESWDGLFASYSDLMYTADFDAVPTVRSVTPATGDVAGGSTITITGEALTGATAVTIGGRAATDVRVVSDSEINATVPAGTAGTADVTVTLPSGPVTATAAYRYTAHEPSAPRALTAAAGDGQVTLRWDAPEDDGGSAVTGYVVQQLEDSTWRTVATPAGTTATVEGLQNGTPVSFRVAAVTAVGTGTPTDAVSATPFVFAPAVTVDDRPLDTGNTVTAGDDVVVTEDGLPAGATLTVGLDSDAASIGTATVGADGTVRVTGTLPSTTAAGDHTLVTALTLADGTAGGATATPIVVRAAAVAPAPVPAPTTPPTTPASPTAPSVPTSPAADPSAAPVAVAAPAAPSADELAWTGAEVAPAIGTALALLTVGTAGLVLARRRRRA